MKEVYLSNSVKTAFVDDEDYEKCSRLNWNILKNSKNEYAVCYRDGYRNRITGKRHRLYMHRFILGDKENKEIDHLNHNGLDNRKENLRHCTHKENMSNRRDHL